MLGEWRSLAFVDPAELLATLGAGRASRAIPWAWIDPTSHPCIEAIHDSGQDDDQDDYEDQRPRHVVPLTAWVPLDLGRLPDSPRVRTASQKPPQSPMAPGKGYRTRYP